MWYDAIREYYCMLINKLVNICIVGAVNMHDFCCSLPLFMTCMQVLISVCVHLLLILLTVSLNMIFSSVTYFFWLIFQAVRKLNEAKKLESSAHYNADFGKD